MREKRASPPQDSDGATADAFKTNVDKVEGAAALPGDAPLSTKDRLGAKQLKVQKAAAEAVRERIALRQQQKQERQAASERPEEKRASDQGGDQARSLKGAVLTPLTTRVASLNPIASKAASGLRSAWEALWRVAVLTGTRLRAAALGILSVLGSGLTAVNAQLSPGAARAGAEAEALASRAGDILSRRFGGVAASIRNASGRSGRWLKTQFPALSSKLGHLGRSAGERSAHVFSSIAARTKALAPVSTGIARAGTFIGAHWRPFAAGALLLIVGVWVLADGGLIPLGRKPSPIAVSSSEPIAWLFEQDHLALDERSVFAFAATPEGTRITGFAISGVNVSDRTLDALGGIIKADNQTKDITLAMSVDRPDDQPGETKIPEPGRPGAIPPRAQFKLVFAFPDGGAMTPGQVLSTLGGLMLKVHYDVAGQEKSFIHYLSPSFLERQLAEIAAEAKGS